MEALAIMEKKYIKFYQNFHKAFQGKNLIHCFETLSHCGVEHNSELDSDFHFKYSPISINIKK